MIHDISSHKSVSEFDSAGDIKVQKLFNTKKVPKYRLLPLLWSKDKRSKMLLTVIGLNSTKLNCIALRLG